MKIAVISDIHGNMEALEAVENDIKAQECEKIFVLGDYAMAGPEPKDTIQYFIRRKDNPTYTMIQGNTDIMIANFNDNLYSELKEKAPVMAEALKNDSELTDDFEKSFLRSLPVQKEVVIDGVKILLVHGSPRRNNEDILPDMSIDEVEKIIENVEASVILCGHTHIPCGFQTGSKKTIVNVGSVGRPFTPEPKSCYLVINIENGSCVFSHRFVKYNNEQASAKLKRRTFKGADKLAGMLIDPKVRHF